MRYRSGKRPDLRRLFVEHGKHRKPQYELGKCYLDGKGVKPNRARAIEWLEKAAKNGNQQATKHLEELAVES